MNDRKWAFSVIALVLAVLLFFGTMMFAFDPLVRYRSEADGILTYYNRNEMYTNPGVARNYVYDAVLVGTSMVQNTDILECNELLDCNMVKLTYSGGTARNMKTILDVCFASDNDIKLVYWELDEFQLFSDADETRYPLPEYLYEDGHLRDLEYLLNVDIFYHDALKPLLYTLMGMEQSVLSTGNVWYQPADFGREQTLRGYTPPKKQSEKPVTIYDRRIQENLEQNILPLIEENPETKFVFAFVPFSMLYWHRELQEGTFDANVKAVTDVVEKLLEYDNVEIYYFRNCTDITTNLDNYKDYSHFSPDINSMMTQCIANGECRLTQENYRQELEAFSTFTHHFDFDAWIGNPEM